MRKGVILNIITIIHMDKNGTTLMTGRHSTLDRRPVSGMISLNIRVIY